MNLEEYNTPLAPLLSRLAEEFIDDQDLTIRLQRLFKVRPTHCLKQTGSICRARDASGAVSRIRANRSFYTAANHI
jgi:hypothetical protein